MTQMATQKLPDNVARAFQILGPETCLVPCSPGTKVPIAKWRHRPREKFFTPAWLSLCDGQNLAVRLGPISDNLIAIDFDKDTDGHAWDKVNPRLQETTRTRGARGWQVWLRIQGEVPPAENTPNCELRSSENVLSTFSGIHPSNKEYELVVANPPMEVFYREINWPEGWLVPGLAAKAKIVRADIENRFGPPWFEDAKGNPSRLNEVHWAGLAAAETPTLFSPSEGFFQYNEATGAWDYTDPSIIRQRLITLMGDKARATDNPWLRTQTSSRTISAITASLESITATSDPFPPPDNRVHAANGMLLWRGDQWTTEPHDPDWRSRNAVPIRHEPGAKCPRFLEELMQRAFCQEDVELIQKFAGMFVLGHNLAQMFLIIDGEAGAGKSVLANVLRGVIGHQNTCQLRTHMLHERFELASYVGKTLLVGSDVPGDFLSQPGAHTLKSMTGGDDLIVEYKNSRRTERCPGRFNVLIVTNSRLRIRLDGDAGAWSRRLAIARTEAEAPKRVIPHFDRLLVREEGPGILNWCLEGAERLFGDLEANNGRLRLSSDQELRRTRLLTESDSLRLFVESGIRYDSEGDLTTEEIEYAYAKFCETAGVHPIPSTLFMRWLPNLMLQFHQSVRVKNILRDEQRCRGYANVTLNHPGQDPVQNATIDDQENDDPF